MQLNTDNQIKSSLIEAKKEELHHLDQLFKHMKYLELIYKSGKLEHKNRAWYTEIGLNNLNSERERVKREIEELTV